MSLLAVLDPALDLAYSALTACAEGLRPLAGGASTALALVLITLVVRAGLLPLAVSVLRADRAKQALGPRLQHLRRRHASDPARLSREVLAAHREAGISPLAGLLPALAQAPAMLVVYRLATVPVVAGGPNALLSSQFLGVPLAGHLPATIAAAGLLSGPMLLVAAVVVALAGLAHLTSRQQVSRARTAAAVTGQPVPPAQMLVSRLMPYGTVAALVVVPFAVALYLVTSNAWLVLERALLPRLV